VVITRKTQVSEWALGLQRGRLFIFFGCLVVYIFLFFAGSELKDAAKLFQTKKTGETSATPALAKRTLDCTKRGKITQQLRVTKGQGKGQMEGTQRAHGSSKQK
jgi:hypothetical protein